ncbi:hypothetical protein E4T39_04254 [Aureobasidium subglaciale]|nr:hypothetical protein E4T39_04254 [Aureobasidium subglaciale]
MRQALFTIVTLLSVSANAASCQLSAYSCLASNSAASAYCTSALSASSLGVVTSMEVKSRTKTLTNVPTSTVTVISTTSIVSQSTATTFTTSSVKAVGRRRMRDASCESVEDIMSGLDDTELSEACSCIGALPSVEAALLAASRSTTTVTAEVWFTVAPQVTVSSTQTVSVQSIITIEKAAPSFTQVWGPKAGCDDTGMSSAQSFMVATMTEEQVTNICKTTCTRSEQADCVFLYVQSIYPANNFWNCYINTHGFDEDRDLNCSKDTSIWGMAKGYR